MKFIGITDQDKITKDKMISFAVVTGIVLLCVMSSAGIVSMMNYKARSDTIMQDERVGEILDETTTSGSVTEELIIESPDSSTSETTTTTTTEDGTSTTTSSRSSSDATTTTSTSGETTTSKATTTSSKSTTSHTTLKEYYTVVYARTVVNIRSGPGKEYDLVKQLNEGDAIDVVAKTENGWYKTINGNYVLQSLTTSEKPKTTTTTTTTTKGTKDSTKSTTKATSGSKTTIDGKDMVSMGRFKVTFYGPQPLPNGSYSTTTATGTKCKEGRTIAADWSVLPAGTVIYVKNDPLGGDGYYTVEDKGGGVRGKMIDIYVDDESRWDDTTYVEVYIVK